MIIKTYGLYDSVAKEYVKTFVSKDDAVAERSCRYIVRDPSFDTIAGKDYVVVHLYDMDSASGKVCNNDCKTICAMATFMAEYEAEKLIAAGVKQESEVAEDVKSESTIKA